MKTCYVILAVLFLTSCADGARSRPVVGAGTPNPPADGSPEGGTEDPPPSGTKTKTKTAADSEQNNGDANREVCPHKEEVMCKIWETLKGTGDGFYEPSQTSSSGGESSPSSAPKSL